jgi:Ca-activated chloride channel family protein
MEGERMDIVKKSVVRLLKTMKPTDNICIITFSDRAEVLIPPTQAVNVNRLEYEISLIRTGGGTEIYQGIDLGSIQLRRLARVNAIKQLILLTDGHTYGDEEKCYNLAKECARNGIKINALGIGHEWNDVFLDQLTGLSGGTTSLALSSEDLPKLFEQLVGLTQTIFARELKYEFLTPTYVKPCYAFRISPEFGPVPISAPLYLGNIPYDSKITFIFEFLIDKTPKNMDLIHLANGYLTMNLPGTRSAKYYLDLSRKTTVNHTPEIPSSLIIHALSRLALYRLQERAQNEVKHGDYKQASKHLQYLATHLLSQGDRELAHTVLLEAEHIHQTNGFSKSGDKRIKYGTRSLIIPRTGVK